MSLWKLLLAEVLLIQGFMVALSNNGAAAQPLCASLFESEAAVDLRFKGLVYSPILLDNGRPYLAQDQLLRQFTNTLTGRTVHEMRKQYRDITDDYIGFLPTPADWDRYEFTYNIAWGIETFLKGFSRHSTPEELDSIRKNDSKMFNDYLASHRLGYAMVSRPTRKQNDTFSAFIRIYDGTDYSHFNITEGIKARSSFLLPTELSLAKNNIKTEVFNNYRKAGYQIFQIGKYVLSDDLTPAEMKVARKEILKWILHNYLNPQKMLSDKVIFIINVDNVGLERTYRTAFGTTVIDPTLFDPPIQKPDAILVVDDKTLRDHLSRIIAE